MHATILAYMFTLIETNKITVHLNPVVSTVPLPGANISFVQDFVANLLRTAFPHLTDNQIKITVSGLFNLDQDIPAFKEHLRDFLVQIREFTGEDDSDLFLEEREGALKKAHEDKRRFQLTVPGMLNPHEVPEEMQEM
jgi:exportin-1